MKIIISVLSFLLFTLNSCAQKDHRALLEIRGGAEEFCISKDSTIWIATKTGDTYYTEEFNKPWKYGSFKSSDDVLSIGQTFERASFFNKDTGYISGFIQKGGKEDFIYWTNDGGKSWDEIIFGKSSWIDANYIDFEGNAWMSGNSQLIYYSSDFGKTWTSCDKIEPKSNMRINTIYFEDQKKGVVGGFWNRIYLTNDNCKTWMKVPSPLDQKKYERHIKGVRPTVYKVQIFNNNIVINQQNKIFYSKLDAIDWQELKDATDFSYDKYAEKLYLISSDLHVVLLDENFQEKWKSHKKLINKPISVKPLNGSLYTWHRNEMYKINESNFQHTKLFTDQHPIKTPYRTAKATFKKWGVEGKEIFQSDDFGINWYRVDVLPFVVGNFKPVNDNEIIISDSEGIQFYRFTVKNDTTKLIPFKLEKPLDRFLKSGIKEVVVEIGSQGCFHYNFKRITYQKNDTLFTTSKIEMEGHKHKKEKFKNSFSIKVIEDLLDAINDRPNNKVQMKDFNISEGDIKSYLSKIESLEKSYRKSKDHDFSYSRFSLPYNKVDFEFYRTKCKSINSFNTEVLNQILGERYGGWSTTTNWLQIKVVNNKKDELIISNSDDLPNAWCLPWMVKVDGISFPINMIEITQFFDSNTPDDFLSKELKNVLAIFQIVDYLYKKEINFEE
jgi:hypothetical protein